MRPIIETKYYAKGVESAMGSGKYWLDSPTFTYKMTLPCGFRELRVEYVGFNVLGTPRSFIYHPVFGDHNRHRIFRR